MSGQVLIAVSALAIGCSSPSVLDSDPRNNFSLLDSDGIASRREFKWAIPALVETCCPDEWNGTTRLAAKPACRELQRVIERHPQPTGAFSDWGPACYEAIPSSSLLVALKRGVRDRELVLRLAELDPTPQITRGVFDELLNWGTSPSFTTVADQEHVDALVGAIALTGEQDLELVTLHMKGKRTERYWAARVFSRATEAPLEMQSGPLWSLIDDPEQATAGLADTAAAQLMRLSRVSTDGAVSRLLQPTSMGLSLDREGRRRQQQKHRAIALLGRRRAFCESHLATVVLETLQTDTDRRSAYLAERAIGLRAERCGDKLAKP